VRSLWWEEEPSARLVLRGHNVGRLRRMESDAIDNTPASISRFFRRRPGRRSTGRNSSGRRLAFDARTLQSAGRGVDRSSVTWRSCSLFCVVTSFFVQWRRRRPKWLHHSKLISSTRDNCSVRPAGELAAVAYMTTKRPSNVDMSFPDYVCSVQCARVLQVNLMTPRNYQGDCTTLDLLLYLSVRRKHYSKSYE